MSDTPTRKLTRGVAMTTVIGNGTGRKFVPEIVALKIRVNDLVDKEVDEESIVVRCWEEADSETIRAVFNSFVYETARHRIAYLARSAQEEAEASRPAEQPTEQEETEPYNWQQEAGRAAQQAAKEATERRAQREQRKARREKAERAAEEMVTSIVTFQFTQAMLNGRFNLNGKSYVFKKGTPQQHLAVVAWFDTHIDGCGRTRDKHEHAARLCLEHGVGCLDDLPPEILGL